MAVPQELPLLLQTGSFTTPEALRLGVPYSRLRRVDFRSPSRELRQAAAASLFDRAGSLSRLLPNAVISHESAAVLWGMWLPGKPDESAPIHLTRPTGSCQTRRREVVGHRAALRQEDVVTIYGVRVTSPAWTWVDMAAQLFLSDLVAAGDSLLRRTDGPRRTAELNWPDPLTTTDSLSNVISRRHGVRGIRLAREALPLLRYGVDSAPESSLRLLIVQSGLPEPEVNQWIRNDAGRRISMPDLQYKDRKVALEYEGEHHLLDADQWNRDIDRDDRLRALGWTVLRFSKKHLRLENSGATISKIRGALRDSTESRAQL